jgi:hypothetical protein
MDADLDLLLTTVFVTADDLLPERQNNAASPSDPPSRKPPQRITKPHWGPPGQFRDRALASSVLDSPCQGSRSGLPPPISTSVPSTPVPARPPGEPPRRQPRHPSKARSSLPALRVTNHTALRRPVELRPSSPGHTPPGPAHWPDTHHKTRLDPSDRPRQAPSRRGDPPATNPSVTAATTSPARGHTR